MIINTQDIDKNGHVKFVSYSGRYPTLCSGILVLEIDGVQYKFSSLEHDDKEILDGFWVSGGGLTPDYDLYSGEWKIDVSTLPEQFRKYAEEIDKVFNENVEYGCCGGCI